MDDDATHKLELQVTKILTKLESIEEKLKDNINLLHSEIEEIKEMANGRGCNNIQLLKQDLEDTKGRVKKCETIRDNIVKAVFGAIFVALMSLIIYTK